MKNRTRSPIKTARLDSQEGHDRSPMTFPRCNLCGSVLALGDESTGFCMACTMRAAECLGFFRGKLIGDLSKWMSGRRQALAVRAMLDAVWRLSDALGLKEIPPKRVHPVHLVLLAVSAAGKLKDLKRDIAGRRRRRIDADEDTDAGG